ncbi:hypothetical protein BC828DRAFT_373310 [Blastocladiella britannica]|nr:hypothetical protein BC828DRAFT_373310 [Blastocladiella britannica]
MKIFQLFGALGSARVENANTERRHDARVHKLQRLLRDLLLQLTRLGGNALDQRAGGGHRTAKIAFLERRGHRGRVIRGDSALVIEGKPLEKALLENQKAIAQLGVGAAEVLHDNDRVQALKLRQEVGGSLDGVQQPALVQIDASIALGQHLVVLLDRKLSRAGKWRNHRQVDVGAAENARVHGRQMAAGADRGEDRVAGLDLDGRDAPVGDDDQLAQRKVAPNAVANVLGDWRRVGTAAALLARDAGAHFSVRDEDNLGIPEHAADIVPKLKEGLQELFLDARPVLGLAIRRTAEIDGEKDNRGQVRHNFYFILYEKRDISGPVG